MKKFAIVLTGLGLLFGNLYASPDNFDIFGVGSKTKQLIMASCSDQISEYAAYTTKLLTAAPAPSPQQLRDQKKLEEQLIAKIRPLGHFSHAKVSSIYYPADNQVFMTLDLVKSRDKNRLPKEKRLNSLKVRAPNKEVNEMFSLWHAYFDRKYELSRKKQLDSSKMSCPVLHCIWGFDEQDLKDTLPKLKQGAIKHESALMEIIKHSPDDQKRRDAVFILAHGNNYKALAKFLIKFTDDPSEGIRNDVMRVLGAVAAKHEVKQLDINRILTALNYPSATDRNKAGYVLLGMVKHDPSIHQRVINQAGKTLLELLKLQQPNNHHFAFHILKEISKKSYAERDYVSWDKWIRAQQLLASIS